MNARQKRALVQGNNTRWLKERSFLQREHLKLRQAVSPEILSVVRDLLLDGDDVDAIGILARELDLVPREGPYRVIPVMSRYPMPPGDRCSIAVRDNASMYSRASRFGVARECSGFMIDHISDVCAARLVAENVPASAFVASFVETWLFEVDGSVTDPDPSKRGALDPQWRLDLPKESEIARLPQVIGTKLAFSPNFQPAGQWTVQVTNDGKTEVPFIGWILAEIAQGESYG